MAQRPLHSYETMLIGSNMSLAVQVLGNLTLDKLHQAFIETARIHPILRMEINFTSKNSTDNNPIPIFQEKKNIDFEIYAETAPVTTSTWQKRLITASNSPQLNFDAISRIQLFSDPDTQHHDLILVFNHAGLDGIGIFFVLETLLQSLAKPNEQVEKTRDFQDILGRLSSYAQEIPNPKLPSKYLPPLTFPSTEPPETPAQIIGVWAEFSEQETEKLRIQCRNHECTIQSSINTAEMVAILNYVKKKTLFPQTIVHMVPVNMRPYVEPPLELQDCVCGSSAVLWSQIIDDHTGLWESTKDSTNKLKHEIARKAGLRWWYNVAIGDFIGPPTFMASSIGKTPIQSIYGEYFIENVKILGSAYDKNIAQNAGTMVHAYTVCNKLNITFAYTKPPISEDWAQKILADMKTVLKMMINGTEDISIAQILKQL